MKVFSRAQYKRVEGEKKYEKNKSWVDKFNNVDVIDGKCLPEGYRVPRSVKPEWCVNKKGGYKGRKPVEVNLDDLKAEELKAEDVTVDYDELQKQRREEAIKEGGYCMIELIVRKGEKIPICSFEANDVTSEEVATLLADLEATLNSLRKEFPMEAMMSKMIKVRSKCIKGRDTRE